MAENNIQSVHSEIQDTRALALVPTEMVWYEAVSSSTAYILYKSAMPFFVFYDERGRAFRVGLFALADALHITGGISVKEIEDELATKTIILHDCEACNIKRHIVHYVRNIIVKGGGHA